ncbi:oligopeptide ABC transporter, ATP-binding protein AppF [Peptostreptococcaceae bacterium oral taxon 113 str. W5053]|nr:oligopeptide ABC transporter, ATP-binding protein AppF [Peptostreptococcaceae bacterium oral taxon 113 str. W5053]
MKNALEVKKLVKYFPVKNSKNQVVHAVDNVSFSIQKGKTLGLVGESGCGKSTCARTIIRIHKPTSGEILIDGENIANKSQKELQSIRRKMQMIFQDPYASLNGRMIVRDLIAEPLIAHNIIRRSSEAQDLIEEMLERVGLQKEHINRYAHEFSGGQRQRICIARALILKPDIILCDEPISALDVSIQAQIVNMLKQFQNDLGLTYLFIAHDLSMVRYVSDDVGVMYLGKLVELCEAVEIYRKPLHPYTKGLLSSIPIPSPKLAREKVHPGITGDIASPINVPTGCRFHTRCKEKLKVCEEIEPEIKEISDNHYVACHLYK